MTEKKEKTRSNNGNLRIPSREEFHRYQSNNLSAGDFCTYYSSGYVVQHIAESIEWTLKHCKKDSDS